MLMVAMIGWASLNAATNVRDLAHAMIGADTATAPAIARELLAGAERTVTMVFYGILAGIFVVVCISMPIMHYSIAVPVQKVAEQMDELAGGNTEIVISQVRRNDEVGVLSSALVVLRDAVRRNNAMVAEIKARDDREARLIREAAIRDKVEQFSAELSNTTQRLGDMTKHMAQASETMIVAARRATEGSGLASGA